MRRIRKFLQSRSRSKEKAIPDGSAEPARFSADTRRSLEEHGYYIFTLTGQSIKSIRESGHPFFSTWHKKHPEIDEELKSMLSEVAINPDPEKIFLANSKSLLDAEAIRFIEDFSKTI